MIMAKFGYSLRSKSDVSDQRGFVQGDRSQPCVLIAGIHEIGFAVPEFQTVEAVGRSTWCSELIERVACYHIEVVGIGFKIEDFDDIANLYCVKHNWWKE